MVDKMKMFKTFFPIRTKIREVKKFPEKFNDGFLLGPRLVLRRYIQNLFIPEE